VGFYPGESDCPVAFLECDCCLPDFFYKVFVIFFVLEGLKGNSAVCVCVYVCMYVFIFLLYAPLLAVTLHA
jgi:hypothetical protein